MFFYLFSMGDLLSGRTDLGSFRPHNQQVNASRAYHHQVRSNQMIQGQDITNTTTTYYVDLSIPYLQSLLLAQLSPCLNLPRI